MSYNLFEVDKEGWKNIPIKNIAEVNPTNPENEPADSDKVSFIPMRAVGELSGKIDTSEEREWVEVKKGYTRFQEGDIIFAKITPSMENGKVAIAKNLKNKCGAGSTEFHVIRSGEDLMSKYLFYFLIQEPFRREAESNMTGTAGQMRVPKEFVEEFQIPLPPITEQKKIISKIEEIFSKINAGTKELEEAEKRTSLYKRSLLRTVFEGDLTSQWRENKKSLETTEELLNRTEDIREEECGGKYDRLAEPEEIPKRINIPEEWSWTSLSKIGSIGRGRSDHRPRDDPKLFGGKYPFIQTGDVRQADRIIDDYNQTYNETGLEQSKLWPEGTLCITIAANIGETAILGMEACFPDSVVGFRTNPEYCNVNYVQLYFRVIQSELERYAPATAQKNINLGTLTDLPIPLPPVEEQNQIVDKVQEKLSSVADLEKTLKDELEKSERLKESILKKAFRGRLVDNK